MTPALTHHGLSKVSEVERAALLSKEEAAYRAQTAENSAVKSYEMLKDGHDKTKLMFDRTLETLTAERADHAVEVDELRKALEASRKESERISSELLESQKIIMELRHALQSTETADSSLKIRVRELEAAGARDQAEIGALRDQVEQLTTMVQSERHALAKALEAVELSRAQASQMFGQTEVTLKEQRENRNTEVRALQDEIERLLRELSETKRNVTKVENYSSRYVAMLQRNVAELKYKLYNHPSTKKSVFLWWRCTTLSTQLQLTQEYLDDANNTIIDVQRKRANDLEEADKELQALRNKRGGKNRSRAASKFDDHVYIEMKPHETNHEHALGPNVTIASHEEHPLFSTMGVTSSTSSKHAQGAQLASTMSDHDRVIQEASKYLGSLSSDAELK